MRNVVLFAEDFGHEAIITPLLLRLAGKYRVSIKIRPYSVRGGHGRALSELTRYRRDLERGREPLPDLLVVAIDANCRGYIDCRDEIEGVVRGLATEVALAIPDPHAERWLLLDSSAFNAVLGKGCNAPDQKCDRDRYKAMLAQAIRASGVAPLIGGMEHAQEIVGHMNLDRMKRADSSLGRLLEDLDRIFQGWSNP